MIRKFISVGADSNDETGASRESVMSKVGDALERAQSLAMNSPSISGGTGQGIGKYLSMFQTMMTNNGSYGVKARAKSETIRRTSIMGSVPHTEKRKLEQKIQEELVSEVMDKVNLFTDMSVSVGKIFDSTKEAVEDAAKVLFKSFDKETGQIELGHLFTFLDSIGLDITAVARETLQAIFGCELGDLHQTLTKNGTEIEEPFINIDSLSICLLAAIPLMSGRKGLEDYLPSVINFPLISQMARELIEHVTNMLHMENSGDTVHFSDQVVKGLDVIFVMISASFEDIVEDEWRISAQDTLSKLQSGLHSMNDHPNGEVQVAIDEFSAELKNMLTKDDAKAVDFLRTNNE